MENTEDGDRSFLITIDHQVRKVYKSDLAIVGPPLGICTRMVHYESDIFVQLAQESFPCPAG
mgnify:FL=1